MSFISIKNLKLKDKPNLILFLFTLLVIPLYPSGPFLSDLFVSLSSLIFIYIIIRDKNFIYFQNKIFKFFIILFIFITVHSLFSIKPLVSLQSSFFYFRFFIFALAICYLLSNEINYKKYLYNILFLTLFFVVVDTYIQYFFGKDIFGYEKSSHRLSGPFGNELIVGSFIGKILPVTFEFKG